MACCATTGGGIAFASVDGSTVLSDEDRRKLARSFLSRLSKVYHNVDAPSLPVLDNEHAIGLDAGSFVQRTLPEIIPNSILARAGVPETMSDEEMFLLATVEGISLPDVSVLYRDGVSYVGLDSLFYAVDFPISVTPSQTSARGWFRRESSQFHMDADGNNDITVVVRGEGYSFPSSNVIVENEDIYVPMAYVRQWFLIDMNISYRDQELSLIADFPLPIQERIARNQMKGRLHVGGLPAPKLPLRNSEYRLFAVPFMDVQISTQFDNDASGTDVNGNYSVIGGGDLLNMSANYFVGGTMDDPINNMRLSMFRESPEGDLLGPLRATYLGIGDIGAPSVPLIKSNKGGRGIRVGNRPIGTSLNMETADLRGDVQPGWDVELYRNGQLVERQTSGADGLYEFLAVPLNYGENDFKVIMYGPQGQIREKTQSIPLNQASVSGDDLMFDLAVVQQGADFLPSVTESGDRPKYFQFSGQIEKNFGGLVKVSGGFSNNRFDDDSAHKYLYGGANIFLRKSLLGISAVKDLDGGHAIEFDGRTQLGTQALRLGYSLFQNNFQRDEDDLSQGKDALTASVAGPMFKLGQSQFLYTLSGSVARLKDGGKYYSGGFNLGTSINRWQISNALQYYQIDPAIGQGYKNTRGSFQVQRSFDRFRMRTIGNYTVDPVLELQSIQNAFYWSDDNNRKYQFSAGYQPSVDRWNTSAGIIWDTKYASLTPNVSYNSDGDISAMMSVRFGLGQDPYDGAFKAYNKSISQAGAVAARVFEDLDMDGVYDEGEILIEGAEISGVQARRTALSGPTGVAFLTGLRRNMQTDVELDMSTLSDPFWIPAREGISIKPRLGTLETLDIPIIKSNEIEGVVHLQLKSGTMILGNNVPMLLKDVSGNIIAKTISSYDGFYLFGGIPPGHYLLSPEPEYLLSRDIMPVEPYELKLVGGGDVLMGRDFKAVKQGAGYIPLDLVGDGVATKVIHLGDYDTALNIKVMWLKLRQSMPESQRHLLPVLPFSAGLLQNSDGTFPLMVGPVEGDERFVEDAVCPSFTQVGIACGLETVMLPN